MASFTLRVVTGIILWFGLILSSLSIIKAFFLYGEMIRVDVMSGTSTLFLVLIVVLMMVTVVPCILGLIGFHTSYSGFMFSGVFLSRLCLSHWMIFVIILDVTWTVHEDFLINSMTESLSAEYKQFLVEKLHGDTSLLLLKAICFINIFTCFLVCSIWCSTSIVYRYYKKLGKKRRAAAKSYIRHRDERLKTRV